jgi:hypothetical protein
MTLTHFDLKVDGAVVMDVMLNNAHRFAYCGSGRVVTQLLCLTNDCTSLKMRCEVPSTAWKASGGRDRTFTDQAFNPYRSLILLSMNILALGVAS